MIWLTPLRINGITINRNKETGKPFVSAPAFPNRYGKYSPIIWMPDPLWKILSGKILMEYCKKTGEATSEEEIDFKDFLF